jgi:hypothetical protein
MSLTFEQVAKQIQARDEQRARFEEWAKSPANSYPFCLEQNGWGVYTDMPTAAMWAAWNAGQKK